MQMGTAHEERLLPRSDTGGVSGSPQRAKLLLTGAKCTATEGRTPEV